MHTAAKSQGSYQSEEFPKAEVKIQPKKPQPIELEPIDSDEMPRTESNASFASDADDTRQTPTGRLSRTQSRSNLNTSAMVEKKDWIKAARSNPYIKWLPGIVTAIPTAFNAAAAATGIAPKELLIRLPSMTLEDIARTFRNGGCSLGANLFAGTEFFWTSLEDLRDSFSSESLEKHGNAHMAVNILAVILGLAAAIPFAVMAAEGGSAMGVTFGVLSFLTNFVAGFTSRQKGAKTFLQKIISLINEDVRFTRSCANLLALIDLDHIKEVDQQILFAFYSQAFAQCGLSAEEIKEYEQKEYYQAVPNDKNEHKDINQYNRELFYKEELTEEHKITYLKFAKLKSEGFLKRYEEFRNKIEAKSKEIIENIRQTHNHPHDLEIFSILSAGEPYPDKIVEEGKSKYDEVLKKAGKTEGEIIALKERIQRYDTKYKTKVNRQLESAITKIKKEHKNQDDLKLFDTLLKADVEFNKRMHIVAEAQSRYQSNKYDKETAYAVLNRLNALALKKNIAGKKFLREKTTSDTMKEYSGEIFDFIFAIAIGSAAFLPFMEKAGTLASSSAGKLALGVPAGFATALLYAMQAARFREVLWEAVSVSYQDPSNLWKLIVHLVMNYYASTSVEGVATLAFKREDRIMGNMGLGENTGSTMQTLTLLDIEASRAGAGIVNSNSCLRETKGLRKKVCGVEGFAQWLRERDLNSALAVRDSKDIDRRTKLGTLFPAYGKPDETPTASPIPNYGSTGHSPSRSNTVTPNGSDDTRLYSYQNDGTTHSFETKKNGTSMGSLTRPDASLGIGSQLTSNTLFKPVSGNDLNNLASPTNANERPQSAQGPKSALRANGMTNTAKKIPTEDQKKRGFVQFSDNPMSPHVHRDSSGKVTAKSEPGESVKKSATPGKSYGTLGSN